MRGVLTALACVAALSASPARATPPDTFGFGSRPVSMGGAVTADIEDGSSSYYNPAGLARGSALRVGGLVPWESPLYKAGVAQDDQIASLGGVDLTSMAAFEEALAAGRPALIEVVTDPEAITPTATLSGIRKTAQNRI